MKRLLSLLSISLLLCCEQQTDLNERQELTSRVKASKPALNLAKLKFTSSDIEQRFPLLPLLEEKSWKALLQAERNLDDKKLPSEERRRAHDFFLKIAAKLDDEHPLREDKTTLSLGKISFDKDDRHIAIPARINYPTKADDDLELILCTRAGRTHETLMTCDARPLHLEILLHFAGFNKDSETPSSFHAFISLPGGTEIPVESLIINKEAKTPKLPQKFTWVFSGSSFGKGGFYSPDQTGDFLICQHVHDSVLQIKHQQISIGQHKLRAKPHPELAQGCNIKLILRPR